MKSISIVLIIAASATLVLGIVAKFMIRPDIIFGVGTRGYVMATMILLLYAANLALIEVLKKK